MTKATLKQDIVKFESVVKQLEGKKTVSGNPSHMTKLAKKCLEEKKEQLAKMETEDKTVKVVVRIGRSGSKIHPAIAEKYTLNGVSRFRNVTPCCNCPHTSRGGDSTYTVIAEGHDLWNCRK